MCKIIIKAQNRRTEQGRVLTCVYLNPSFSGLDEKCQRNLEEKTAIKYIEKNFSIKWNRTAFIKSFLSPCHLNLTVAFNRGLS